MVGVKALAIVADADAQFKGYSGYHAARAGIESVRDITAQMG
jgi:hypothetical protein